MLLFFVSCKHPVKLKIKLKDKELVADAKVINAHIRENLKNSLLFAMENNGKINDTLQLTFYEIVENYYRNNDYNPIWSDTGKWLPATDSLESYLNVAALDGLFKQDYHFDLIYAISNVLKTDSLRRTDAIIWTKADMLLTDAFMHIARDLSQGRLQHDSNSWRNDTSKYHTYFFSPLDKFRRGGITELFQSMQPSLEEYQALKSGIKTFIDSMDTTRYTYVNYPYRSGAIKDSIQFLKNLLLRLSESVDIKYITGELPDSSLLADYIKKYQKNKKMPANGKISPALINLLNTTDVEKYNRIAITLDRYKQLPVKMPVKYILVNLPAFYLKVCDSDSIAFYSRIICGKPLTPTPQLTAAISDIVIYPTWTVPESIIKKEMLPGLKKNVGYLARKGLYLYNYKGEKIDPSSVNWAKYTKGIPYKIQQGSGDDNALGVIKFNFNNPYSVYLHDTNQRYLFKNGIRALSHGCVRVQDWQKLAFFLVRNDSMHVKRSDSLKYNTDSIVSWIARKEKHHINVKFPLPLFIRYFSCEGKDGGIKFYDDIYEEDKRLKEKFFPGK